MQIKVLFNKDALNKKFHTGWGSFFLNWRKDTI